MSDWAERASRVWPRETPGTLSKGHCRFVEAVPFLQIEGNGAHTFCSDGERYLDWISGLGAIILGHHDDEFMGAIKRQLRKGTAFSLPHSLEIEVAELLCDLIPSAERVRFVQNGGDATNAAVRLARAVTGRDTILASGYFGHHDWYIAGQPPARGIPACLKPLLIEFPWNDKNTFRVLIETLKPAAVIFEVRLADPGPGFLKYIRMKCDELGVIMIADEICTFPRWRGWSAQTYYGIVPDLTCVGKGMSNGFPVAALVGKAELMDELGGDNPIFVSTTYGGSPLGLAAVKATLRIMQERGVVEHIWMIGKALQDGYKALIRELGLEVVTDCPGHPPRTVFTFTDEVLRGVFIQEMAKRKIIVNRPNYATGAHSIEDVKKTLDAARMALVIVKKAWESDDPRSFLEGPPPRPVFTNR